MSMRWLSTIFCLMFFSISVFAADSKSFYQCNNLVNGNFNGKAKLILEAAPPIYVTVEGHIWETSVSPDRIASLSCKNSLNCGYDVNAHFGQGFYGNTEMGKNTDIQISIDQARIWGSPTLTHTATFDLSSGTYIESFSAGRKTIYSFNMACQPL